MREASELRAAARESLSGKWGGAVVVTLVYVAITGLVPVGAQVGIAEWVGSILQLLLIPVSVSYMMAFLDNNRSSNEYKVEQLFECFKDYTRLLGTSLLMGVYTFLWALLLIIPGIIKGLSYGMTYFILRDYPELKYNSAIELSMAMMKGHKWDLFYLYLTFIGWILLACLTLGIGFLWLNPYMYSTMAHFYEDVKAEYEAKQVAI